MKCHFFFAALFIGVLSSCNSPNKKIYVKFNNISGLSQEAVVSINGFSVGEVSDISLLKNGTMLVALKIDRETQIPKKSTIKIISTDFLGSKSIEIDIANSNNFLTAKDTLIGLEFHTDSLVVDKLKKVLNSVFENNKEDSLLIELRRFNENIEKNNK